MARPRRNPLSREFIRAKAETKRKAEANCPGFLRKVAEAKRAYHPQPASKPLFHRVLSLATFAAANGSCARAGREIGQAKRIAKRHSVYRDED